MRVIENHGLDELILTRILGWKWISFIGIPAEGTPGYPGECRVRELISPKDLRSKRMQEYLAARDCRDADGNEPLSSRYCSSMGPPRQVRLLILVDEE